VGPHSLKFGVAVERMQENMLALSSANGVFNFGALSEFLTNQPIAIHVWRCQYAIGTGAFRQTLFGVLRARRTGDGAPKPDGETWALRYEDGDCSDGGFKASSPTLINITDPAPHLGLTFLFESHTSQFSRPRVGFAWDPFPINGKTALPRRVWFV